MRDTVAALEAEFWRYKALGDSALAQLDDDLVSRVPAGESNSVAVIVWHLGRQPRVPVHRLPDL